MLTDLDLVSLVELATETLGKNRSLTTDCSDSDEGIPPFVTLRHGSG